MEPFTLTIGPRHFLLPAGTDVAELEERIEDAVRRGGAMVRIPAVLGRAVDALVTPASAVFVDPTDPPEDPRADDPDSTAHVDFDLHGAYEDWVR